MNIYALFKLNATAPFILRYDSGCNGKDNEIISPIHPMIPVNLLYHRLPFVDHTASPSLGSQDIASSSAFPKALKHASAI